VTQRTTLKNLAKRPKRHREKLLRIQSCELAALVRFTQGFVQLLPIDTLATDIYRR
jgi:hypothetical protein